MKIIDGLKLYLILFLGAVIMFVNCPSAIAQFADSAYYKHNKIYYMAGFGIGGGNVGVHAYLNATLLRNGYELTGRIATQQDVRISFGNSTYNYYDVNEYALLVGKNITRHPLSHLVLSTGVAFVDVTHRGEGKTVLYNNNAPFSSTSYDYESVHKHTVGLPVDLKYFNNAILKYIVATASLGADINPQKSFFYITLGMQFGNTRERPRKKSNN